MISAPGEPPGSRVTMLRNLMPAEALGQLLDLGRFARPLPALKGDEAPATGRV